VHQEAGKPAVAASSRFSRKLLTKEQPYARYLECGSTWQPLDCGWVKRCSCMVLENRGKNALRVIVGTGRFSVLPGESMRCCPDDLGQVLVKGNTEFHALLVPL